MVKILSTKLAEPKKGVVGVGSGKEKHSNRAEPVGRDKIDDGKDRDNEVGKKGQKTSKFKNVFKSKKLSKSKKTIRLDFFILGARLTFTKLR